LDFRNLFNRKKIYSIIFQNHFSVYLVLQNYLIFSKHESYLSYDLYTVNIHNIKEKCVKEWPQKTAPFVDLEFWYDIGCKWLYTIKYSFPKNFELSIPLYSWVMKDWSWYYSRKKGTSFSRSTQNTSILFLISKNVSDKICLSVRRLIYRDLKSMFKSNLWWSFRGQMSGFSIFSKMFFNWGRIPISAVSEQVHVCAGVFY